MRQAILSAWQEQFITLTVAEPKLSKFYLTGGTALAAYYLEHRFSDDLDFFTNNEPDTIFLQGFITNLKDRLGVDEVRFRRVYDRNQFFLHHGQEQWRVEFVRYPFRQLEETPIFSGLRVDSRRDIAANKLMALLDRFEPKDFVDLFFILKERSLESVRADAQTKFGMKIGALFLGSELAKAQRIAVLPKMMKPLTLEALKKFFAERAKELAPEVLK